MIVNPLVRQPAACRTNDLAPVTAVTQSSAPQFAKIRSEDMHS
jgi:hypothetical protein